MKTPTVSAVMRVYNGERHVAEALTSILVQTRPADEVIVVDDGSTDATSDILAGFGDAIRVVAQKNSGHTPALNRAYTEARCEFIANCDSDDLWEPTKLERQVQAVTANPDVGVAFGGVRSFGLYEKEWLTPETTGVLPAKRFADSLFRRNLICASATLVRQRLYEQLGPFNLWLSEDYEYWLRAMRARAVFYYDPSVVAQHREHEGGATRNDLEIQRATYVAHMRYADLVVRQVARGVLADDLNRIGRLLAQDEEQHLAARDAFRASLRHKPTVFASAWLLLLTAPSRHRTAMIDGSVRCRRWVRARAAQA